jgi:hypothetical protein
MKLFHLLLPAFLFLAPGSAPLHAQGASQTVGGIEISYGVIPSRMADRSAGDDGKMHRGRLFKRSHHLVVSLTDAASGKRIDDAKVVATVTPLGLAASRKRLKPMKVDDLVSYGNFFDFPAESAPYRISLSITRPSMKTPVTAEFQHGR